MSQKDSRDLARRLASVESRLNAVSRSRQLGLSTIPTDDEGDEAYIGDLVKETVESEIAYVAEDVEHLVELQDEWAQFGEELDEELEKANEELATALAEARESLEESGQARGEAAKAVEDAERAASDAADAIRRALEASGLASGAQSTADSAFGKAVDAQTAAVSANSAATAASSAALEALGLASTGKVWVQDTAPPKGKWYQWLGERNASVSVEMDGDAEARRNLAIRPLVPEETGATTGWRANGGATTQVDPAVTLPDRTRSVKVTLNANWVSTPGIIQQGSNFAGPASSGKVAAGERSGCWLWLEQGRVINFTIFESMPGNSLLGARMTAVPVTGTGAWQWVEGITTSAKTSAANGLVLFFYADNVKTPGSPVFSWWVSDALNQPDSTPGPYFDGDTQGDRDTDLWIDTGGGNTPHRFVNGEWVEVTDKAAKDAAAAAASAAQAAQDAQQTANQADSKADTAQTTARSAQSTADTARQAAEQASSDAVSKAAAAEAAAKAHAEAQAEAARLAAIAAASGDASAKADAAQAAAEAAAASDASTKAEAARVAAEAKASEAKSAADAAKSRADAAHSLAGTARETAEQAQTTASGKNSTLRSTAVPSGTGGTAGDKWERYTSLAAGGKLIGTWAWSGSSWVSTALDESYLPLVNIGQGTYGDLSGARLVAQSVLADAIAANAVTAVKIAANAVTAVKLAANAVTAEKINAGAVATEKLAALAVTAEKLAAGSVVADKIAANAITAAKIAAGAIDGMVITGALMRTASSGQRMEFDVNGLRAFNSSDVETVAIRPDVAGLRMVGPNADTANRTNPAVSILPAGAGGLAAVRLMGRTYTGQGNVKSGGHASLEVAGTDGLGGSQLTLSDGIGRFYIINEQHGHLPRRARTRIGANGDTDPTQFEMPVEFKHPVTFQNDEQFTMSPSVGSGRIVITRSGRLVEIVYEVYTSFGASGHTQIGTLPARFCPPSLLSTTNERRSGAAWFGTGTQYGSAALFTDGRLFVANTTGAARTEVNGSLNYLV